MMREIEFDNVVSDEEVYEGYYNLAPEVMKELLTRTKHNLHNKIDANPVLSKRVLNIISLTNDPASQVYMNNKAKTCSTFGIECKIHKVSNNVELIKLLDSIKKDNNNRVIVQYPYDQEKFMPLERIFEILPKYMDVDGFTMNGLDLMKMSKDDSNGSSLSKIIDNPNVSPTSKGVIKIIIDFLIFYDDIENCSNRNITIIGKGLTSGLPLANLLPILGFNVTVVHSKTTKENFDNIIKHSDIVISCAGVPNIVNITNPSHVESVMYINVGMSKCKETGKMLPDISPFVDGVGNVVFRNELFGTTGKLTTLFLIHNVLL